MKKQEKKIEEEFVNREKKAATELLS